MAHKKNIITTRRIRKTKIIKPNYELNPQIKNKEDQLKKLQIKSNKLKNHIGNMINDLNAKTTLSAEASKFLERLPLDSLQDFQNFSAGKKIEYNLDLLRARSKLRKDCNKKMQILFEINQQIVENQIDLLLAKIDHIMTEYGEAK